MADVIIIFHFGLFLPFSPHKHPKNQYFKKMKKKNFKISLFYTYVPKIMIRWCTVLEYGAQSMDGQMDGRADKQTEKVTYRGGCPT